MNDPSPGGIRPGPGGIRPGQVFAVLALAALAAALLTFRGKGPPPGAAEPPPRATVPTGAAQPVALEPATTTRAELEALAAAAPEPPPSPPPLPRTRRTLAPEEMADRVLPAPAPEATAPGSVPRSRSAEGRKLDDEGLAAWDRGDVEGALAGFRAAVEADPVDVPARRHLGRLLTLMAVFREALPHLEKAAELEPHDPRVWLDLRTFYEKTLLLERAAHARRRAEKLAGSRAVVKGPHGFWLLEGDPFP